MLAQHCKKYFQHNFIQMYYVIGSIFFSFDYINISVVLFDLQTVQHLV